MAFSGSQRTPGICRWGARAAVVLGGALVGSAAAWVLSTAAADAAPVDSKDRKPAAERLAELPEAAAHAARGAVEKATGALRPGEEQKAEKPAKHGKPERKADEPDVVREHVDHEQLPTLDELNGLLSSLLDGGDGMPQPPTTQPPACAPEFEDWCERLEDWFQPQPGDLVPGLPVEQPGPDAGHDLPSNLPAAVTSPADAQQSEPAEALGHAADVLIDVAAGGLSPRGDPLKNFPGGSTPLHLPGQPAATAPGSGTVLAGHADGSPLAITAASAAAAAGGAGTALRRITPGSSRPGGQPGVTPD